MRLGGVFLVNKYNDILLSICYSFMRVLMRTLYVTGVEETVKIKEHIAILK